MKIKILFQPRGKWVTARSGDNLLQTALKNRIPIRHRCGGNGSCTTCKVRILSKDALISDPSTAEIRLVGEEAIHTGYRLACQTRAYGNTEISIPEEKWKAVVREKIQQQGGDHEEEENEND